MRTWTPAALSSEARPLSGRCWRIVEAQHVISTLKLVDTLAEQELLERLLGDGEEGLRILSTLHRALRQVRAASSMRSRRRGTRSVGNDGRSPIPISRSSVRRWTDVSSMARP